MGFARGIAAWSVPQRGQRNRRSHHRLKRAPFCSRPLEHRSTHRVSARRTRPRNLGTNLDAPNTPLVRPPTKPGANCHWQCSFGKFQIEFLPPSVGSGFCSIVKRTPWLGVLILMEIEQRIVPEVIDIGVAGETPGLGGSQPQADILIDLPR